jgi:hypothetical protein
MAGGEAGGGGIDAAKAAHEVGPGSSSAPDRRWGLAARHRRRAGSWRTARSSHWSRPRTPAPAHRPRWRERRRLPARREAGEVYGTNIFPFALPLAFSRPIPGRRKGDAARAGQEVPARAAVGSAGGVVHPKHRAADPGGGQHSLQSP